MVKSGDEQIDAMFVGEMGIKKVCVGDETIYTRQGGYLYLELNTSEEE